jgi:hypothetical protein
MGANQIQLGVGYPNIPPQPPSIATMSGLAQRPSASSEIAQSIESAVEQNKQAIRKDTREALSLSQKSSQMVAQIQQLRANDERLTKELIQAELKRVNH